MSKSNKEKSSYIEKKRGSLARCYEHFNTDKARKKNPVYTPNPSTKAGVLKKLEDARFINTNTTDQQPTPVDRKDSIDGASVASSTDSTNITQRRASGGNTVNGEAGDPTGSAIVNDTQGVTCDSEVSATCSAEEVTSTGSYTKTKGPEESARLSTSSDESKVSNNESEISQKASDNSSEAGVFEESTKKKIIDHMADVLTDPQLMWEEFFSGIVTDYAADAVEENLSEKKLCFTHSEEEKHATDRAVHRLENVCNLPLKLILTPLQRGKALASTFASKLEMQFGPLHAALQVGSVILEWNDTSLVTPYLCNYEEEFHVMKVDMQPHSEWVDYTTRNNKMKEAAEKLDFTEQIDQIYMVTSKKKEMIDALIDVIIRYNKHYYYNLFDRNCQNFVIDALEALQVKNPTGFTGGLSDYFKELVKGRTPSIPKQFKTHQDLDAYVTRIKREGRTKDMPQHDLEFILTLYFRFHLKSKEELRKNHKALEKWKCQEANCQMEELERLINLESLKLHGFRQ